MTELPRDRRTRGARASRASALLIVLVLLVGALGAGCERRAQQAPPAGEPAAALLVTADHGSQVLLESQVAPDQSLMRALRGATEVRTEYAGGFVAEMLGRASDLGSQRDWFVFVNGILSPVGARDVALADGDRVWWDHRHWGVLESPWAVVGAWPAPFSRPVGEDVFAEAPLDRALEEAGASVGDDPQSSWRVRVGAHEELVARDPAWARAHADPALAGLSAWFEDGAIVSLDASSGEVREVPGAAALIAAVPKGPQVTEGVVMVVAGVDDRSARRAAEALAADANLTSGAYALVLDGTGEVLHAGGRSAE